MFALSFDEGAFLSVVFIGFEVSLDSVFFYKKLVFSARFSVTKKNDSTIPPNPPKHSHIPRMATQKKKCVVFPWIYRSFGGLGGSMFLTIYDVFFRSSALPVVIDDFLTIYDKLVDLDFVRSSVSENLRQNFPNPPVRLLL